MPIVGLVSVCVGLSLVLVKWFFGLQSLILTAVVVVCYLVAGIDAWGFAVWSAGGDLLSVLVREMKKDKVNYLVNPDPTRTSFLIWLLIWPILAVVNFVPVLNAAVCACKMEIRISNLHRSIRKLREAGLADEEIKDALMQNHWGEQFVTKALEDTRVDGS